MPEPIATWTLWPLSLCYWVNKWIRLCSSSWYSLDAPDLLLTLTLNHVCLFTSLRIQHISVYAEASAAAVSGSSLFLCTVSASWWRWHLIPPLHTLKELKVITQSWHGNLGSRSFLYFPTSLSYFICSTIMWNLHSGNSFFHRTVSESMWLIHPVLRSPQLTPPPPCSIIHVSIVDFSLFCIFLYFVRSDYVLYFDFAARCKLLKRDDEVLESRLSL